MSKVTVFNGVEEFEVNGDVNIQECLKGLLGGKFFKVSFIKKNGDLRDMNGRMGVSKYVKGTGHGIPDHANVGMYIPALETYRKFNISRMKELTCGDIRITGEAA